MADSLPFYLFIYFFLENFSSRSDIDEKFAALVSDGESSTSGLSPRHMIYSVAYYNDFERVWKVNDSSLHLHDCRPSVK